MAKNFLKSESAVSEVVGFIFVFSIVMLAISVIYAVGYPAIQSSKENTQFQNMEQSFMVLQSNINTVAFGQAPGRTLETSLGGGSITVNSSKGRITVGNGTEWYSGTIGAIEYEKEGRRVAYEGGGVWKKYPAGAAIKISEPRIFVHNTSTGNRTVFVSIINISSENGISSVGGEGTASVVVKFNRSHTPDIYSSPETGDVNITVTSDYADAWKRYFEGMAFDDVSKTDDVVTATISVWSGTPFVVIVNEHVIEVEVS